MTEEVTLGDVVHNTNGKIFKDTYEEYEGYEFVLAHVFEWDACYIWEVDDIQNRKQEMDSITPDGTTIAIPNEVPLLGFDYGTYVDSVSRQERREDCRAIIDKLNDADGTKG